jgi:hypothetical protein
LKILKKVRLSKLEFKFELKTFAFVVRTGGESHTHKKAALPRSEKAPIEIHQSSPYKACFNGENSTSLCGFSAQPSVLTQCNDPK